MSDQTSSMRPAKRPREDDRAVIPLSQNQFHPNLSFEDGNVIIATDTLLFRVHRGILGLNSSVFGNMLSLPQPLEGEARYEGLPVVYLFGDCEEDVVVLLRAMYERSFYAKYQATSYETISALLRLSTKYAVDSIRKDVIGHLASLYPSTLAEYDSRDRKKITAMLFPSISRQPFVILSLARSASADILLPVLFYECAKHSVDDILGYKPSAPFSLQWERNDLSMCLAGRQKLSFAIFETVFKFFYERPPVCYDREMCKALKHGNYVSEYKSFVAEPTVFQGMSAFGKGWGLFLCEPCKKAMKASVISGREELWSKLPEYFGLQKWEILRGRA